jgi:carboxymethylenebutenolidase
MASETYVSGETTYKITVNPGPSDGKKHPVILLVHGNFGLGPPYGQQIQSFARDLAGLGYLTAVPQYYEDDEPRPKDMVPKDQILADAIAAVVGRADADADQLGIIGFSLGAATAMTFVASNPSGTVNALADFFGFLTPAIRAGVSRFPPTIILHDKDDGIVDVSYSQELDRLLPAATDHLLEVYEHEHSFMNHAFKPGGAADVDSRSKVTLWFTTHLPPTGK